MENFEGVCRRIENTVLFKLVSKLETQIKKNFHFERIEPRPVNSNGLWCFTLIPAILLSNIYFYEVTPVYRLLAYVSIGLLSYSVLFILFLFTSCLILKGSYTSGCTVSVFCAAIPIYCILRYDLLISLIFPAMAVGFYSTILKKCLLNCPRTFTIGEAMIVAQGVSLTLTFCVLNVFSKKVFPGISDDNDEIKLIKTFVITVLSTVGMLVTALFNLKKHNRCMKVLIGLLLLAAIMAGLALYISLGSHFILDFINYVLRDKQRKHLILLWSGLLLAATVAVVYRCEVGVKVTSATRKTLHLLAALVFLSGALLDKHLIALASGLVLGVIVLIEALRVSGIEPISGTLQTAFNVYADEKDVGVFAMTPLYLYVGLACPLALVPWGKTGCDLELLSGVLSIGIGDSAASWFGQRYGKKKWPGSNRTVEGTVANIGSQIFTIYVLNLFGLSTSRWWLLRAGVAGTVCALAEARLDQVDNLVLPLLSLLAIHLTAWLR